MKIKGFRKKRSVQSLIHTNILPTPSISREHESARKGQRDDRVKPRFFQETEALFWIYSPVMVESEGLLGSSPKNVQILVVTDTEWGMNRRYDNYLRVMELNQGKDPKSSCLEKQ